MLVPVPVPCRVGVAWWELAARRQMWKRRGGRQALGIAQHPDASQASLQNPFTITFNCCNSLILVGLGFRIDQKEI